MSHGLPHTVHLAVRLQREWDRLTHDRRALGTVHSWELPGEPARSLDEVLARAGYGWHGDTASDALLLELVRRAADDFLAARIVLQRVLPGIAAIARRRGHDHPGAMAEAFEEMVAWSWQLVRTYPVERRPRWVAANLVRDACYHAFTREQRLRRVAVVPIGERAIAARPDAVEPICEVIDVLRDALHGGASHDDVALLARLTSSPPGTIAIQDGVTERTVRNRRRAAVARVRAAATIGGAV